MRTDWKKGGIRVRKSLREVHGGFPVSDEFRKKEDD